MVLQVQAQKESEIKGGFTSSGCLTVGCSGSLIQKTIGCDEASKIENSIQKSNLIVGNLGIGTIFMSILIKRIVPMNFDIYERKHINQETLMVLNMVKLSLHLTVKHPELVKPPISKALCIENLIYYEKSIVLQSGLISPYF
ncbi:hypothetical protein PHYBLDRAFT_172592 [Phycomyces blakesleeanus NRRL 1555(-)]|uniref:Uncharacterized protein n=1 Tax=Phycomyces blakesleeanus (strain ATCC 8743b / DSM 1359 / FGSC 10004 / NBRC 33097 / NRRL 1555) TaxID=763407 RepID=A0A162ZVS1_PHYB8|nr:hypothetical protein PHYBLDRAFT_172592 [Phycomyces blakesleeanus NRRL 1555(-)]OAD69341.1 hypothetical protein PHYBLDRAFT_172592 [Phycomyces blakesleeanus NRRL 1555(-)]|eukprot:XP_018287381.1 hypothetical protein PHYBLDRAFT_172592 [Phycomyces blakesleeanus NRRL 1555(-)]